MTKKSLLEMFQEATLKPVPYEGLSLPSDADESAEPIHHERVKRETVDNPHHKEDFMSLLSAAARTRPQAD
jgi:hypothetical protein